VFVGRPRTLCGTVLAVIELRGKTSATRFPSYPSPPTVCVLSLLSYKNTMLSRWNVLYRCASCPVIFVLFGIIIRPNRTCNVHYIRLTFLWTIPVHTIVRWFELCTIRRSVILDVTWWAVEISDSDLVNSTRRNSFNRKTSKCISERFHLKRTPPPTKTILRFFGVTHILYIRNITPKVPEITPTCLLLRTTLN